MDRTQEVAFEEERGRYRVNYRIEAQQLGDVR